MQEHAGVPMRSMMRLRLGGGALRAKGAAGAATANVGLCFTPVLFRFLVL